MKFIDVLQGSTEWHELRRTKIGASNSPALLGISPYKTSSDIYREMVLGESGYVNKAMKHGTDTESEARDFFNNIKSSLYDDSIFTPAVVVSDEYDIMMASLDGINESRTAIVEIKCPGQSVYLDCTKSKVPVHWEYQIQHQLCVTGLDLAILFVYRNPEENIYIVYGRDEGKIAEIVSACDKFEKEHLSTYTAPESKSDSYAERYDPEWENTVTSYLQFKKQRIELETVEKMFHQKLIDLCNDKPSKGSGVRVERSERKGTVDYSLIEEIKDIDLDQYRKPATVQWRICEIKS